MAPRALSSCLDSCIDKVSGRDYSGRDYHLPLLDDGCIPCIKRNPNKAEEREAGLGGPYGRARKCRQITGILALCSVALVASQQGIQSTLGRGGGPRVTVVIPATSDNLLKGHLRTLERSIEKQARQPDEVILALTGFEAACKTARTSHKSWDVVCLPPQRSKADAQNEGAKKARGDVVSFVDAEDRMQASRIHTLQSMFATSPDLQMVLHGWKDEEAAFDPVTAPLPDNYLILGSELYDMAKSKNKQRIHDGIIHSHVTVRRDLLDTIKFRSQDFQFTRNALTHLGPEDGKAVYVKLPLSSHIPDSVMPKEWWQL